MKLYRYVCGMDEKYGAAEDEQDAYERRMEVDPTFHFLPVRIEEVTIEGYDITVTPTEAKADTLDDMTRDELKAWLTERNIDFTPQWGEAKLRELALQHGG